MLILTRRVDEWFHIMTASGEKISIKLSRIKGNQARIGIVAPGSTAVIRNEAYAELEQAGINVDSASDILAAMASHRADYE